MANRRVPNSVFGCTVVVAVTCSLAIKRNVDKFMNQVFNNTPEFGVEQEKEESAITQATSYLTPTKTSVVPFISTDDYNTSMSTKQIIFMMILLMALMAMLKYLWSIKPAIRETFNRQCQRFPVNAVLAQLPPMSLLGVGRLIMEELPSLMSNLDGWPSILFFDLPLVLALYLELRRTDNETRRLAINSGSRKRQVKHLKKECERAKRERATLKKLLGGKRREHAAAKALLRARQAKQGPRSPIAPPDANVQSHIAEVSELREVETQQPDAAGQLEEASEAIGSQSGLLDYCGESHQQSQDESAAGEVETEKSPEDGPGETGQAQESSPGADADDESGSQPRDPAHSGGSVLDQVTEVKEPELETDPPGVSIITYRPFDNDWSDDTITDLEPILAPGDGEVPTLAEDFCQTAAQFEEEQGTRLPPRVIPLWRPTDDRPNTVPADWGMVQGRWVAPCRFWASLTGCRAGDSCEYWHDPARRVAPGAIMGNNKQRRRDLCRHGVNCTHEGCTFRHITAEQKSQEDQEVGYSAMRRELQATSTKATFSATETFLVSASKTELEQSDPPLVHLWGRRYAAWVMPQTADKPTPVVRLPPPPTT